MEFETDTEILERCRREDNAGWVYAFSVTGVVSVILFFLYFYTPIL